MLAVITIMLVALAVLNAIFTTWATVLDARRATALMHTAPPASWLAATVAGTLLAMAALTIVPARIGLRQPVADALQAEAA